MNVLIIAPLAPDLPDLRHVESEVAAVEAAFSRSALTLRGEVTRDQVLRVLAHGWNIIWVAGHGAQQGIMLSDGLLGLDEAMVLMRQAKPGLVVLNTCESGILGMYLHHELKCPVVCTVAAQGDRIAYITGRLLAQYLADGCDVATAFLRSRPGELTAAQNYRLFSDAQENRGSDSTDELRTLRMLNEWGKRIDQRIGEFEVEVGRRLDQQDERLGRIEQIVARLQMPSAMRRWSFAVAWLFLMVPVIGFFSGFREIVGMSWPVGWAWAMLSWGASAVFFAYGLGVIVEAWQQILRIGAAIVAVFVWKG